jgi:ABC-type spermidine/putrescine transport system permease subunit I
MCWRSIAAKLSLDLRRPVHLAALHQGDAHDRETASIATVGALVLAYPLAYVSTKAAGCARSFSASSRTGSTSLCAASLADLLGDNGLINKMLMRLGVCGAARSSTTASVLVAMIRSCCRSQP